MHWVHLSVHWILSSNRPEAYLRKRSENTNCVTQCANKHNILSKGSLPLYRRVSAFGTFKKLDLRKLDSICGHRSSWSSNFDGLKVQKTFSNCSSNSIAIAMFAGSLSNKFVCFNFQDFDISHRFSIFQVSKTFNGWTSTWMVVWVGKGLI